MVVAYRSCQKDTYILLSFFSLSHSSSHCQWSPVWKSRNNVFHFALPWGFTSSWVTRQCLFSFPFFSLLVFFILFFSLFLIGSSQKVSCLSNKSWNEEWLCRRWQMQRATEKKEKRKKTCVTNWTFFCHNLFININACLPCNVKRLQKETRKRCIADRIEHCFR